MPEASTLHALRRLLMAGGLPLLLQGCSIVSPWPLWELAKAGGAAASTVIGAGPGTASDTVTHLRQPLPSVCIEYNPAVQVSDIVPVLQSALRERQVESRVYESPQGLKQCPVWLRYSAYLDWDIPPFSNDYRLYISTASLTLQTASGAVLSSSHYSIDTPFGRSKWASTRAKLTPVVTALLTPPQVAALQQAPAPTSAQRAVRGTTP